MKEVGIADIWDKEKTDSLSSFIVSRSKQQSKERLLRNELLSIRFQIEDYIESEENPEKLELLDFVKMYLKIFNITQKRLAELFEMKDSNLHKYLVGERKLNTSLLLKLSSFSRLSPEYWLRIEVKNELVEINKQLNDSYSKYDYLNLLITSEG